MNMNVTHPDRTTRSAAVGRFRKERMARRPKDMEDRQSMILAVAERLVAVMQETHDFLDTSRDQMERTRANRLLEEERLKKELAAFRIDLHDSTVKKLSDVRSTRMTEGQADKKARLDGIAQLRDDVVRIVSEDFF